MIDIAGVYHDIWVEDILGVSPTDVRITVKKKKIVIFYRINDKNLRYCYF